MKTMKYEVHRDIPVAAEPDVLVIGGGPGGVCASVMAARQGVKTMMAERYGCPGGMAVFGEVTPFMISHVDDRALDRPVYIDWCRRMQQYRSDDVNRKIPQ